VWIQRRNQRRPTARERPPVLPREPKPREGVEGAEKLLVDERGVKWGVDRWVEGAEKLRTLGALLRDGGDTERCGGL